MRDTGHSKGGMPIDHNTEKQKSAEVFSLSVFLIFLRSLGAPGSS
jgi:hypothetical protein